MTKLKNYRLSDEELDQFHKKGFIGPFVLYTPEEIEEIYKKVRAELFNREHAPYKASLDSAIANYDRHLDIEFLSRHICRKEIVNRLERILGDDILCWRSEFIPKRPGSEGTDWHQADTFAHASGKPQLVWPDENNQGGCINVWTAFTDATDETACLVFIPGTQEEAFYDESKGLKFNPEKNNSIVKEGITRGFNGYDYRELQVDKAWVPDESKSVSMVMKAGEFIIFRSKLLHASKPNLSKTKTRLGYVARYIAGDVQVYPDTDYVEEFGGKFSLTNYGVVEVKGSSKVKENRLKNLNNRGLIFDKVE